jgi:RHS repeat-associated protein
MIMPGRKFTAGSGYRYGFNGKEEDDEVKGDGNQQDYGMRIYDTRLGRFLSVDPLTKDYPHYTPYSYAGNKPIKFIDLDGLEEARNWTDYTFQDLMNWIFRPSNPFVKDGFVQQAGRSVNSNFNLLYNGYVLATGNEPDLPSNVTPMTRMDAATNIVTQVTIGKATGKLLTPTGPAAVEKQMAQNAAAMNKGNTTSQKPTLGNNKSSTTQSAILGETKEFNLQQSTNVYNAVKAGNLPGSNGAYIGGSRLTDVQMQSLSNLYNIEFAQVYTAGTGSNGAGGFYTLYSGTLNRITLPVGPNTFLINHTHPSGTTIPSILDINYLLKAQSLGSPQNSSVILPAGKPPVKFNKNTPANGTE